MIKEYSIYNVMKFLAMFDTPLPHYHTFSNTLSVLLSQNPLLLERDINYGHPLKHNMFSCRPKLANFGKQNFDFTINATFVQDAIYKIT